MVGADTNDAFETELTLPVEWPGTQTPIVERELVIAAVDEAKSQTLAVAQVTNAAAVRAEPVPTVHNVHSVEVDMEQLDPWLQRVLDTSILAGAE